MAWEGVGVGGGYEAPAHASRPSYTAGRRSQAKVALFLSVSMVTQAQCTGCHQQCTGHSVEEYRRTIFTTCNPSRSSWLVPLYAPAQDQRIITGGKWGRRMDFPLPLPCPAMCVWQQVHYRQGWTIMEVAALRFLRGALLRRLWRPKPQLVASPK